MSDFIREVDEEVRNDRFKQALNRYWVLLLVLMVLVLAAVGGWRGYDYLHAQKAETAGGQYLAALDLARDGKSAEATTALDQVIAEAPPAYRLLARFRLAAEQGTADKAAGAKLFDELAADPGIDPAMQNVARLRAALLLVDTMPYEAYRQRLAPLADANSPTRNLARELLAIAALKADKTDEAGRDLDAIETDPTTSAALRQRAEQLLGLVRSAGTAPAAPAQPAATSLPAAVVPPAPPPTADAPPAAQAPVMAPPTPAPAALPDGAAPDPAAPSGPPADGPPK